MRHIALRLGAATVSVVERSPQRSFKSVGGPAGGARLDVGQSYRTGRAFSYGSLSGQLFEELGKSSYSNWYDYGLGAAIGVGGGGGARAHVLAGVAPFVRRTGGNSSPQWMMTISLGVRYIGHDREYYVAPRFDAFSLQYR